MFVVYDVEVRHCMYGNGDESWEIFVDNVLDSTHETVSRVFEALERIRHINNFTFTECFAN